ncbi:unnamed protein product, partial [Mesorhabditis belari]|uniref:Uncharacterized protein n=1 Tax=Mesorhabditis belari TaxID=2138241 RepID=A0AAF3J6D0_9BILA
MLFRLFSFLSLLFLIQANTLFRLNENTNSMDGPNQNFQYSLSNKPRLYTFRVPETELEQVRKQLYSRKFW